MESVDIAIIGAGVIGLAVSSEIGQAGRSVFVLEKNSSWGQETSSRNSEVIHAGIYYQPGSLKAISCIKGRERLYSLCKENDIGFKKCGKLIVAVDESELEYIETLYENGIKNGVTLFFLGKEDVAKMEPKISCIKALYSPDTGIVDSHALMEYFLKKGKAKGVEVVCEAEVVGIEKKGEQYLIKINNQGEQIELLSRVVINCSGLNADKIAALCGIDIETEGYHQYYLKGNYFRLTDKFRNATQRLVYPVPDKNSLGIHTVIDLNGGIRLGPDEEEVGQVDYQVNEGRKQAFFTSVKKFFPEVEEDDLYSDMAGIRPQLRSPNNGDFKDFIISHEAEKGLPGLINLIGVESPGLTSSPYIAQYVGRIVDEIL